MAKKNPEQKPPKPVGRPTIYNQELGHKICKVVATHALGLTKLCNMFQWMPHKDTINEWRWSNEQFSVIYTKAKIAQAELLAEDCVDIADDTSQDITFNKNGDEVCNTEFVNRSRLRVDTRKWLAAKLLPRIYGETPKNTESDKKELSQEAINIIESFAEKYKKDY